MLRFEDAGGLSLAQTLTCGQCFRWQPQDGGWRGVVEGREVTAFEEGRALVLAGAQEGDRAFWHNYFALDLDYPALLARYARGSKRLAACVQAAPGIRVLRQPFFETLVTFIISQNNNIPRIRGIVQRLCEGFGETLPGGGAAFPTAARLAGCSAEQLAGLRAGWRADYILDAARRVAEGRLAEDELRALPLAQAREALMQVRGVGPKVADCTLLYGLGRWEAFPLDVWMKRAMAAYFPRGIPRCCRRDAGIAQQFIFAYARANLPAGRSGGE